LFIATKPTKLQKSVKPVDKVGKNQTGYDEKKGDT
jgi:hypothetical protein